MSRKMLSDDQFPKEDTSCIQSRGSSSRSNAAPGKKLQAYREFLIGSGIKTLLIMVLIGLDCLLRFLDI
jgi:hypothetical protein